MSESVLNSSTVLPKVGGVPQLSYSMRLQKVGLNATLLAGLVLGIAMMVGVLGFLAWRGHVAPAARPTPAPAMSTGHTN